MPPFRESHGDGSFSMTLSHLFCMLFILHRRDWAGQDCEDDMGKDRLDNVLSQTSLQ